MFLDCYFYKTADFFEESKNALYIKETLPKRDQYMNDVFFSLFKENIKSFEGSVDKKTALIYVAGASEHHSTSRNFGLTSDGTVPVKSQLGYIVSKLAKRIGNINYVSVNANACASGLYAIEEAKMLIDYKDFDEVIVYAEEWVENVELKLFSQLNIDIVCSDGLGIIKFVKENNGKQNIIDINCIYGQEDRSPFEVTTKSYLECMKPFKKYDVDIVKMHGTPTPQNMNSETAAIKEVFGDIKTIEYKSKIGHSQGASAVIEFCMIMDKVKDRSIVLSASGLGNFYGALYAKI